MLFHSFANVSLLPSFREKLQLRVPCYIALLHCNMCWMLRRTNLYICPMLHIYSDRKVLWLLHTLLKVLSLEPSSPLSGLRLLLWLLCTHYMLWLYIKLFSGALFSYCHIFTPYFPSILVCLPQNMLWNLSYPPPFCVNTFLVSSSLTILYCSYCVHVSFTHLHAWIRSVTLLPAL